MKPRKLARARSRVSTLPARTLPDGGSAVGDLDGESAEVIFAVGHAGGAHGVGDEDGAVGALRVPPDADDFRSGVDAVADEFGEEGVVGED